MLDEIFPNISKIISAKIGVLLIAGMIISAMVFMVVFSILLIFTNENVEKTERLTTTHLEVLRVELEKEKAAFLDKNKNIGSDIVKQDTEIVVLSNIIETTKMAKAQVSKAREQAVEGISKSLLIATEVALEAQIFYLGIKKQGLEKKLIPKEDEYITDFQYYLPKVDEIDWKEILTISSALDKQKTEIYLSELQKAKTEKNNARYKELLKNEYKYRSRGTEFNEECVKEVLSTYFKRVDFVSQEVVRYKRNDYIQYQYLLNNLKVTEKILTKPQKIMNVKILPKTTEEVMEQFKFNAALKLSVRSSLGYDLRIDEKGREFINKVNTTLEYVNKKEYGQTVKVANTSTEAFQTKYFEDPTSFEEKIEYINKIDSLATKKQLEWITGQNLSYNPTQSIANALNYVPASPYENPTDKNIFLDSQRKAILRKSSHLIIDYDGNNNDLVKNILEMGKKELEEYYENNKEKILSTTTIEKGKVIRQIVSELLTAEHPTMLQSVFIKNWDLYFTVNSSTIYNSVKDNFNNFNGTESQWIIERGERVQRLETFMNTKINWIYKNMQIKAVNSFPADYVPGSVSIEIKGTNEGVGTELPEQNDINDIILRNNDEEFEKGLEALIAAADSAFNSGLTVKKDIDYIASLISSTKAKYGLLEDKLGSADPESQKAVALMKYIDEELCGMSNQQLEEVIKAVEMGDEAYSKYREIVDKGADGVSKEFIDFLKETSQNEEVYKEVVAVLEGAKKIREGDVKWGDAVYQDYSKLYENIATYNGSIAEGTDLVEKTLEGLFIDVDQGWYMLMDNVLGDSQIGFLDSKLSDEEKWEIYAKNLAFELEKKPLIKEDKLYQAALSYGLRDLGLDEKTAKSVAISTYATAYILFADNPHNIMQKETTDYDEGYKQYYARLDKVDKWEMYKQQSYMSRAAGAMKDIFDETKKYAGVEKLNVVKDISIIKSTTVTAIESNKLPKGFQNDVKEIASRLKNMPSEFRNATKQFAKDGELLKAWNVITTYEKSKLDKLKSDYNVIKGGKVTFKLTNFDSTTFTNSVQTDKKLLKEFAEDPFKNFDNYINDELQKRYLGEHKEAVQLFATTSAIFLKNPRDWGNTAKMLFALSQFPTVGDLGEIKSKIEKDIQFTEKLAKGELTAEEREALMKSAGEHVKNYVVDHFFGKWCEAHGFPVTHVQNMFNCKTKEEALKNMFYLVTDPVAVKAIVGYFVSLNENLAQSADGSFQLPIADVINGVIGVVKFFTDEPPYTSAEITNMMKSYLILQANKDYTVYKSGATNTIYDNMKFSMKGSNNFELIRYVADYNHVNFTYSNIQEVYEQSEILPTTNKQDIKNLKVGDIGLSRSPFNTSDALYGVFSGEFDIFGRPLFFYFNYPPHPPNYYNDDPMVAGAVKQDTILGVPDNIVSIMKDNEQQNFYKNQVYTTGSKYLTPKANQDIELKLADWHRSLTEKAKVFIYLNGKEDNKFEIKSNSDKVVKLKAFLEEQKKYITYDMDNFRRLLRNSTDRCRELNARYKNSPNSPYYKDQLEREIQRGNELFQKIMDGSGSIEYINFLLSNLSNPNVNILFEIQQNAQLIFNDNRYEIKVEANKQQLSATEIENKRWEFTRDYVRPKMEGAHEWREPNLAKFDTQTKETYQSGLDRGNLVKAPGNFTMYIRFFNKEKITKVPKPIKE